MSRVDVPVLIVGAGPVGMMAALLLAQQGVASRVVERREGTHQAPQAHVVNPRSLEICRMAGIDMDLLYRTATPPADGGSVEWTTTLAGPPIGRISFERQVGKILDSTPTPIANLSQHLFEPILLARLRQEPLAEVCFGHAWESCEQDAGEVRAQIRDATSGELYEVQSRYLLAADGAGSRVRRSLGIEMVGPEQLASFIMIHVEANLREIVKDRPAILYWVMQPEHSGVFIAHDIDRTWVFMKTYDPERESPDEYDDARCRAIVEGAIGGPHPELVIRDRSPWTMTAQIASRYREGRIFLVGDAAHRFPPTGGIGLNTGVADAHNLVWKIVAIENGWAPPALLDSYESERRDVAQTNSNQSLKNALTMIEVVQALGIDGDPVASAERMEQVLADPEQRARVEQAIENQQEHFDMLGLHLGFSYELGAVVPDGTEKPVGKSEVSDYVPTTRPGSRVPHAWLARKDGERVSTLDLLPYDAFTLVTGAKGIVWAEAARRITDVPIQCLQIGDEIVDADGRWAELCEIEPDGALLVRPDQHVAWRTRSAPADPHAALREALREVLA